MWTARVLGFFGDENLKLVFIKVLSLLGVQGFFLHRAAFIVDLIRHLELVGCEEESDESCEVSMKMNGQTVWS